MEGLDLLMRKLLAFSPAQQLYERIRAAIFFLHPDGEHASM